MVTHRPYLTLNQLRRALVSLRVWKAQRNTAFPLQQCGNLPNHNVFCTITELGRRTNSLKCKEIRLPRETAWAPWLTCRDTWSKRTQCQIHWQETSAQGLNPFLTVSTGWSEGTESLEPPTQGGVPLTPGPCSHACPGSQKKDSGLVGRFLTSLGGESSNHRRKETGPTHRILLYFTAEQRPTHRWRAESPLACRDMQ